MKLLTFKRNGELKVGIKTTKGILDLEKAANVMEVESPGTIADILKKGNAAVYTIEGIIKSAEECAAADLFLREEELDYGPCVPNPGKIICVGLNYKMHAEESNMDIPSVPVLFNKFPNTIAACGEPIEIPDDATKIDYEAELVIVIGKKAKQVAKDEALDYVFGYCNGNDVSARDLQMRTSQWLLGKSCDSFCPIGPYLVTANEVGNPNDLTISLKVNGEIRQSATTAKMIFYCDELVSYISQYMTLEPGDIILSGTPEGVMLGYPADKQVWLESNDEITVEIEKLGVLQNKIK